MTVPPPCACDTRRSSASSRVSASSAGVDRSFLASGGLPRRAASPFPLDYQSEKGKISVFAQDWRRIIITVGGGERNARLESDADFGIERL